MRAAIAPLATALFLAGSGQGLAQMREHVFVVGSSTVYPFATVVAERFGQSSAFKTPKVEQTGSGGGLKLFCAGLGDTTPDMATASRRITRSEVAQCTANGVERIVELPLDTSARIQMQKTVGAIEKDVGALRDLGLM
jgi:phosphate transport system substrate-binding protein